MIFYKIQGFALTGPAGQKSPVFDTSAQAWEYMFGRVADTAEIRKLEEVGFRALPVIWPAHV